MFFADRQEKFCFGLTLVNLPKNIYIYCIQTFQGEHKPVQQGLRSTDLQCHRCINKVGLAPADWAKSLGNFLPVISCGQAGEMDVLFRQKHHVQCALRWTLGSMVFAESNILK